MDRQSSGRCACRMPQDHHKLALLLALSDIAFVNAEAILHHVRDHKIADDDPAFPGLITGVVVSYARPFGENRGLGSLPEEFRQPGHFELIDLQPVHQYLIDMRNKLFAHFDLSKFPALTKGVSGLRPPDELDIEFGDHGFAVTTNEIRPPIGNLHLMEKLLLVQRRRTSRALYAHLASWLGARPPNGKYKLTETGLIPANPPQAATSDGSGAVPE